MYIIIEDKSDGKESNMAKSGFLYSDDNKRYHTQNYHLRKRFSSKVAKIPVDAGFTCPNLDGTKSHGGCIFCLDGSGINSRKTLSQQFDEGKRAMSSKWECDKFIVYLQTHSNTYAPVEKLEKIYREVLDFDGVVGLTVSTRPDCITPDIAALLEEISKTTYLTVELGLQSIFDKTLLTINRGHTFKEFLAGYEELKKRDIQIAVHLINGLPDESVSDMCESVKTVASLDPFAMKLHLLYIESGAEIEKFWREGRVKNFERDEYVNLLCDQIETIPAHIVLERLTGDGKRDRLLSPLWTLKKFAFLDEIDKEFERRGTFQGSRA